MGEEIRGIQDPSNSQLGRIPELDVFTRYYSDLVDTLSSCSNLSKHFVSASIITIADHHAILSESDPQAKAEKLLKPIAAALNTNFKPSFYKMLAIMNKHGNESTKSLVERIVQSDELKGSELGNATSSLSLLDITTPAATPTATPIQTVPQRLFPPAIDDINTPNEANVEFNIVLSSIIQQLSINQNQKDFKSTCYFIIHKMLLLSQEDKKKIANSKSVCDIKDVMDPHWNWSSHRLLYMIIKQLKSAKSQEILQIFDRKINKQMKLEAIHKSLQPTITQASGYCKMIAILDLQKDYSEITLAEGLEIDEFVVDYLGEIGAHSCRAYECTSVCIQMDWNISTAAVEDFCVEATKHKDAFVDKSFLFLKIGNFSIINELPNEAGKSHLPRASLMRVFNDPIHGHIELDPVLLKIIDTPQFQRLRYIKQLGGGYFVFPGASHNRFEHSIGVCHLAGELVGTLKMKQPELGITSDDMLCVKMAGLCLNLGCGPFSYMFETSFIPKTRKDLKNWKHQEASVKMFDYLIEQNKLRSEFKAKDLEFVKDLILCPPEKNWNATGRSNDKEFLYEVFNDPIHGHIELDPVLLKIIDTPQFQRLRYIKQLGGGYFVFPGASHNRFEHSIGVCHLAGELVGTLKMKQPELGITSDDMLCVKMAGLCLNLGCGPFSYMFETSFIPKTRKDLKNWKHQEASVKMFDYLIEQNKLRSEFKAKDLEFVKDLILCPPEKNWNATGRSNDKEFLYEIVTNKRNGIAVNKWDYLARDCFHLGITSIFDHRRFMMFARVIECDGKRQICSRDKEVMNLYDMFYTRYLLHKRAYYHKTVNAVELMICEAFLKADNHVLKKSKIKLSECIDNMCKYTDLTDYVFHEILLSTNQNLKKSKEILEKVIKRELYKYIGRTQPTSKTKFTEEEIAEQIIKCGNKQLSTDDLAVKIITFDYGMEEKNPIDHVRFYAKEYPNQAFKLKKDHVSRVMLLKEFVEQEISVYCKKRDDDSMKAAQKAFTNWCDKAGYVIASDSDFDEIYTPYRIPSKRLQDSNESNINPSEAKKQRMDQ